MEEVRLGIRRSQRELSDLRCRLIMPVNLFTLEGFRAQGIDLLGQHREDFPPQYLHWVEVGSRMSALDFYRDEAVRTEIYDAVQGVFQRYDLLVCPTLACLPVDNAADGNTVGPSVVEGEAASIPAGMVEGLPVGMQIVGRRHDDATLLAASAAFERLRPWQENDRLCASRAL